MAIRRTGLFLGLFAVLGGCASRSETSARPAATVKAVAAAPQLVIASPPPVTPADWLREAENAEKLGAPDVANACRGRAYSLEHDTGTLATWIDALTRDGEHELARRVWAETRRTAAQKAGEEMARGIDAKIAALPPARASGPLAPGSITEAMRGAYEAEAAGHLEDAIRLFQEASGAAPEAYHVAHAAGLSWRTGDLVRARKGLSRARVLLREAGASFQMVPVTTWHTRNAFWMGDKLVLEHFVAPIWAPVLPAGQLQVWSLSPSAQPVVTTYSASPPKAAALSEDGRTLVRVDGSAISVVDVLSGVTVRTFATGQKEVRSLIAAGSGDDLLTVTAAGGDIQVWDANGKAVNSYALEGTTPTIMRVYRAGKGVVHDNVLRDSPTWVVSLALSKDRRHLAAGGSDSKVRLFDRKTGAKRTLEFHWAYEERRNQGGNPDLNEPLDMRFDDKGDRLTVIHTHGELLTWSVADGRKVTELAGTCSVAEATQVASRYRAPSDPKPVPTAEERESCGRAVVARFDPTGRSVVTTGDAVRVRDVSSGAGVALLTDQVLSDQMLAWAPGGGLSMVNLYGAVSLWRPGEAASRSAVKPAPTGPIDPFVSTNGRFLRFGSGERDVAWDLAAKKELPVGGPPRSLLALSGDGRFAARAAEGGVEIAEAATGKRIVLVPFAAPSRATADFSADGARVLLHGERATAELTLSCDVAKAVCQEAPHGTSVGRVTLSGDGRRALAADADGVLSVWDTASGGPLLGLGKDIRSAALSKDGSAVAWLEHPNREERRVIARWRLVGPKDAKTMEIELAGWPSDIALSADGAEAWVLLEGSLWRWRPTADGASEFKDERLHGARRIQVSDDGKTLILTGYDHVDLRATDAAIRPLATLYPLLSGGFLVVSAGGAVDGSADAPQSLSTRVTRDGETLVFDGLLGWDAAHVEGVLGRALAGESVEPVVQGANGGTVTSL